MLARLIVVSNRVSIPGDETKRAGGLEVALRPALQQNGGVWLGWSGKIAPGDELETQIVRHKNIEYVVIDLSKDDFEEYYSGFANRVLWPILHYRLDWPNSRAGISADIPGSMNISRPSSRKSSITMI